MVDLVFHVEGELLFQVELKKRKGREESAPDLRDETQRGAAATHLRLAKTSTDGDERSSEDSLDSREGHEVLYVGSEPEVDRIVVVKERRLVELRREG